MRVEGRCHCGAIQYEAEVQPGTVVVCHCADCQMQSGSAFRANIPAPAHTFRLLQGVPKRYIKVAPSGARRLHAFCENCGSPIYSSAEVDPPHYSLRIGALKQRFELGAPVRQIWAQRRFAWVSPLDGVETFDSQP